MKPTAKPIDIEATIVPTPESEQTPAAGEQMQPRSKYEIVARPTRGVMGKLQTAARLLAQVSTAQGAKKIMDVAAAAKVYARKARLGERAEAYAHQIKIDAQTMLGEFLEKAPKAKGAAVQRGSPGEPRLSENGISKKLSYESQHLAKAKRQAPKVHEQVRNGELAVKKVPAQLARSAMTDEEREAVQLENEKRIATRWLEATCVVLNAGCPAKEKAAQLDLKYGLNTDDQARKLTPERLQAAGEYLIEVSKEWKQLN